ncbi:hypothetical protein, partial [Ruminococcus callidus]
GKGFLGNMTENLQADCVQSRQAGFIQCFLKAIPHKERLAALYVVALGGVKCFFPTHDAPKQTAPASHYAYRGSAFYDCNCKFVRITLQLPAGS